MEILKELRQKDEDLRKITLHLVKRPIESYEQQIGHYITEAWRILNAAYEGTILYQHSQSAWSREYSSTALE